MLSLTLKSPAKLNLFLFVVGRYPNGYHKLYTLFHRVSLSDTLRLKKKSSGFSLRCSNPEIPSDERNLISKADQILRRRFPKLGGVSVHLTKKIPSGGGLGGGSSNAAFYLLGMKKMFKLAISRHKLIAMGRKLGADVPFFLYDTCQALGTGRGDRISVKKGKGRKWFVLGVFKRSLSTPKVYQKLPKRLPGASLTKLGGIARIASPLKGQKGLKQAAEVFQNHLETPALRLFPMIGRVMAQMSRRGASFVRMSGSGPTVFALTMSRREAESLSRSMRRDFPSLQWFVCHSV